MANTAKAKGAVKKLGCPDAQCDCCATMLCVAQQNLAAAQELIDAVNACCQGGGDEPCPPEVQKRLKAVGINWPNINIAQILQLIALLQQAIAIFTGNTPAPA